MVFLLGGWSYPWGCSYPDRLAKRGRPLGGHPVLCDFRWIRFTVGAGRPLTPLNPLGLGELDSSARRPAERASSLESPTAARLAVVGKRGAGIGPLGLAGSRRTRTAHEGAPRGPKKERIGPSPSAHNRELSLCGAQASRPLRGRRARSSRSSTGQRPRSGCSPGPALVSRVRPARWSANAF